MTVRKYCTIPLYSCATSQYEDFVRRNENILFPLPFLSVCLVFFYHIFSVFFLALSCINLFSNVCFLRVGLRFVWRCNPGSDGWYVLA